MRCFGLRSRKRNFQGISSSLGRIHPHDQPFENVAHSNEGLRITKKEQNPTLVRNAKVSHTYPYVTVDASCSCCLPEVNIFMSQLSREFDIICYHNIKVCMSGRTLALTICSAFGMLLADLPADKQDLHFGNDLP